jgi:hypothetical protein
LDKHITAGGVLPMLAWMKASDVVDNGTEVKVTVTIEPNNV